MLCFPNAKINLGLQVRSRYPSGFHEIESIFIPVGLTDILEVVASDKLIFETDGIPIPGDIRDNLCLQAYHKLRQDYKIGPVSIFLFKKIPMGAGLGGGSADVAFLIKCLNTIFSLNLNAEQMKGYAGQIGSDCPFFIDNVISHATGTGTSLQPVDVQFPFTHAVLSFPGVHIATADAYGWIKPQSDRPSLIDLVQTPVNEWREVIKNDFEAPVFHRYPDMSKIKEKLYFTGASYASMTGSGSCIYGLFTEKPPSIELNVPFKIIPIAKNER